MMPLVMALGVSTMSVAGPPAATRSEAYAPRAMAATSHPLATQAALEVMRAGGSAVDGAIAANACLGLMEPTGCGIGGDLFAIVWDPTTRRLHGYNGSGRSPAGVSLDRLREILSRDGLKEIPRDGPLTVTVPGAVDGWFALHERFGKVGMSTVLGPAIGYAREGFPMTPVIAEGWATSARKFGREPYRFPGFLEQFVLGGPRELKPGEEPMPPKAGETWKNPQLASTYASLAERGRAAFYEGEIPAAIEGTAVAGGVADISGFCEPSRGMGRAGERELSRV